MTRSLQSRLERLEARLAPLAPRPVVVYGWYAELPDDYVGERHTALVGWQPTRSEHFIWSEWEERRGPDPQPEASFATLIESMPLAAALDALVAKAGKEAQQ